MFVFHVGRRRMWVAPHLRRREVLQEDLSITSAPRCENDGKGLVTGAYEWCHNLRGPTFYSEELWCQNAVFSLLKLKCIKKWSNNLVPNLYAYDMYTYYIYIYIYILYTAWRTCFSVYQSIVTAHLGIDWLACLKRADNLIKCDILELDQTVMVETLKAPCSDEGFVRQNHPSFGPEKFRSQT